MILNKLPSYCDCDLCIKDETCDYCDKPAKHAYVVPIYDEDAVYRGCDEHEKIAQKDAKYFEKGDIEKIVRTEK